MARKPKIETSTPPESSEISNALRPMRIDITEADIKAGTAMDPTACAAAQALMRITGSDQVKVHRGVIYVKTKQSWRRYKTSASLRMETIVFDRGGEFVPGEYDLQVVPVSQMMPKKKKKSPSAPTNKLTTRRRVIPNVRVSARHRNDEEGEE